MSRRFPSPQSLYQGQVEPPLGTSASATIYSNWNRLLSCHLTGKTNLCVCTLGQPL